MTSKNRPRSSIFDLNQNTNKNLHGISLGPMRQIFVELLCLQAKIANFMLKSTPHDIEK